MLALTGLLNFQSVSAEPRYYDIEVIIFDDADEKYLRSEHWPQKPEMEIEAQPAAIQADETTYPIVASLPQSEIKSETNRDTTTESSTIFQNIEPSILTNEAKRIGNSRHYHMLFYGAWTQEGLDSEHAVNIKLEQLNNHANVRTKNTITGELKIVLARYLHFYGELEYSREHKVRHVEKVVMDHTAADKQEDEGIITGSNNKDSHNDESNLSLTEEQVMVDYYPIKNHRKMRSKVLHYIDHPLVGILVQINPVKKTDVSNSQPGD